MNKYINALFSNTILHLNNNYMEAACNKDSTTLIY